MALPHSPLHRREALAILQRQDDPTLVLIAEGLLAAEAAEAPGDDPLEDWRDLMGPRPTPDELRQVAGFGIVADLSERRNVVKTGYSRQRVADLLGITPQAVSNMRSEHRLVALKSGRELIFPAWQFDAKSPTGLLEGLDELLARYPGDPVSLSMWAVTHNPNLADMSPRDALRAGRLDLVLEELDALTAVSW